ncbi:putative proline-rich protein [Laccaria bicolor S238N-H82]|uniref:Hypothetical proline-rich protein n=1 Tax=Laccaria bicolor (strain S238N-H82 / ATCC MYA-4686) TaxID=486041 RepID=B0DUF9_LACBS|nr:putative proline-rich protein [Laccaria bicolor S238N-H82]EDR01798.1 hypothetical proline-rich protein [Laccaria bicolor S238N-H82]|eukprot:XP_001887611.1 hypothetical proline-rich protein [Laccaria bicolor S238N-H82]
MSRPPPPAAPSAAPNIPTAASGPTGLQAGMTPEAKTIPILSKQRNMSRPPVPMQVQALTGTSATGQEATPPEAQAMPRVRNMIHPSEQPAGVAAKTAAVLIPAPGEAPTFVPLKQCNLARPLPPPALAPTMNQQTGAPIDLPTAAKHEPATSPCGAGSNRCNAQQATEYDPTTPSRPRSHLKKHDLTNTPYNFEYIWADPDSDGHGVKHCQEWLKSALNLLSQCRDPQQVLELLCRQKHEELYRLEMHLRGLELAELELQDARKSIRAAVPKGEGQDDN